jgi:hypothetical protein
MKRVLVDMVQECSESGLGSATPCRVLSDYLGDNHDLAVLR